MKIRAPSTLDHTREFLFPIDLNLDAHTRPTSKGKLRDLYSQSKSPLKAKPPKPAPLELSRTNRLYPERQPLSTSAKRPLKSTLSPTYVKVRGLNLGFDENSLRKSCREVEFCRPNYNKITLQADGTGELMLKEISNLSRLKTQLSLHGLEIEDEALNYGVKHMVTDHFLKIQQTDRLLQRRQHNYFHKT